MSAPERTLRRGRRREPRPEPTVMLPIPTGWVYRSATADVIPDGDGYRLRVTSPYVPGWLNHRRHLARELRRLAERQRVPMRLIH